MEGKAKWMPLELPLPQKILNPKQYQILRRTAEIGATIKDLKDAGVVLSTIASFISIWPMQEMGWSQKMTDYCIFNRVVNPIVASVTRYGFIA